MTKRILLIDDDEDERVLFMEALQDIAPGVACSTESNSREVLKKFDRNEILMPDLIFVDINMPGIDGWTCLETLKKMENTCTIPVVMYSNSSHPIDIDRARQSGAIAFYTKSSNFKDMKRILLNIIINMDHMSFATV